MNKIGIASLIHISLTKKISELALTVDGVLTETLSVILNLLKKSVRISGAGSCLKPLLVQYAATVIEFV